MHARAKIPVLPPQPNPTISYWQDPPDPILADYQSSTMLPKSADVVVIGSGITGSSIAYNLLSSSSPSNPPSIVLLEARTACSGATGRNGGHTKAASYRSFLSTASSQGLATACQIARFEYNTILSLQAFARRKGIECDLYAGQTVDVFYDEGEWTRAQEAVRVMREAMPGDLEGAAKYVFWGPEEARERFSVQGKRCVGAVTYWAGSLSAYKFVMGVLRLGVERGLRLYTHTPVLSVERDGEGGWKVVTERGLVTAKKVVLATNGYTGALWKGFQGAIVPLRGQVTAHRPGSNMPKDGLGLTYSFIYRDGYEYMIPRPQGSKFAGDIVIGGGLMKASNRGVEEYGTVDDAAVNSVISTYLRDTTKLYFGDAWGEDDPEGRVRREWTGIMGYSSDGFPYIGEVPGAEGLWVAASFQGHGMVLCWRCAEALVGMMKGERREWFPDVFKITEERLKLPFHGRNH